MEYLGLDDVDCSRHNGDEYVGTCAGELTPTLATRTRDSRPRVSVSLSGLSLGLVGVAQTSQARAFEHALLRRCGGFPLDMLIPVSLPAICPGLLLSGFLREFPPNRAHPSPGSSSSVAALVMAGAVWSWHRRTVLARLCETRFRVLDLNAGRPSSQPRGSSADLSTTGERLF